MKRCVLIIPYFGKFPNYFQVFLDSCSENKMFDWLLFTDNIDKYNYPENVKTILFSFQEFRDIIQSKFAFNISLSSPYKLCDFKPTYGYVFQEYIRGYEYWGYCDCDLIFGDLDTNLSSLFNEQYDKIFAAGHLTLYKNTSENNKRFMKSLLGKDLYIKALSNPEIAWFDEDYKEKNIHSLFLNDGAKVYSRDLSANIWGDKSYFLLRKYSGQKDKFVSEKKTKAVYAHQGKKIYRYELFNNSLHMTEYIYMHFQRRRMEDHRSTSSLDYIIVPNRFIDWNGEINNSNWERLSRVPISAYKHFMNIIKKKIKRKIQLIFK